MMKIYGNVYNRYRKLTNPKISDIFKNTLIISISYSKCSHDDKKNI